MAEALSITTARQLLDFTGGSAGGIIGPQVAEEQLEGAVALHNLLTRQNVAYLADEVGMGKTYVALGVVALFRHFDPGFRVLVVAPRENIQDKWIREWRNCVRRIVCVEDLRVKGIGGEPARALVKAATLADLVSKASRDHDRDFFARLTSFSLPVSASEEGAEKPRRELLAALPWLDSDLLSRRNKEDYKRNFARAVNCALPKFDLVIVDEGHNLKAGWRLKGATRNVVVGCALGGREREAAIADGFRGYGLKAERVLFLSATPIEHDFVQLWNQLDLLGHGSRWKRLADSSVSDEERREIAQGLLIRRVGRLKAGEEALTKNQYRREWRKGGATAHDEPMAIPDDRQKLTVALVQKKVSEVLGRSEHRHSFQVGLLASFESFAETARVRKHQPSPGANAGDEGSDPDRLFYTHPSASRDVDDREGLDIDSVNLIARDYHRKFGKTLPHPKMDALVDQLAKAFASGNKSLVFVRRVASVDELQRKLEERYDDLLFDRLRSEIRSPKVMAELNLQFDNYRVQRDQERHARRAVNDALPQHHRNEGARETSNCDSFFSWFFRGEGPGDIVSGARLADRFDQVSGDYATFFEDNHVAGILGVPPPLALRSLAAATGMPEDSLRLALRARVLKHLPSSAKTLRLVTYHAFQRAALELLAERSEEHRLETQTLVEEVCSAVRKLDSLGSVAPEPDEWIGLETMFTALRLPERASLRSQLWPESAAGTIRERIRERELRRLLLATMARKGHPIIDLFIAVANRVGTLELRKRDVRSGDLSADFLDLLQSQTDGPGGVFNSHAELSAAAASFQLILTQNVPEAREAPLTEVPTLYGRLLRSQRPVGGMAGSVNTVMVRQFRMPGYPLVLVSTDLLQEGEDLHTFCSSVFHYGIAWMPSALEQRVGRVDRVGSQTERRLAAAGRAPTGDEKLQVYYPHLRETVEVLQVQRVLHRLNRFLRLMHENLGLPEIEEAAIDVKEAMLLPPVDALPIDEGLVSAFDVTAEMLRGRTRPLSSDATAVKRRADEFAGLPAALQELSITWLGGARSNQLSGVRRIGWRVQPFTLLLRSLRGFPVIRCISPVGEVPRGALDADALQKAARRPFVRVSLLLNERIDVYEVAVEGDLVFDGLSVNATRVSTLIQAVTDAADDVERAYQPGDPEYDSINKELPKEADVER